MNQIKEKSVFVIYLFYVLTIFIMRTVLNTDAGNCDKFETNYYPVSFSDLSISTLFFNIFTILILPCAIVKNNPGCVFIVILSIITVISLSSVHFSVIFNEGIRISNCSTYIIVLNILLSVPAVVVMLCLLVCLVNLSYLIFSFILRKFYEMFIKPVKERNFKLIIVNYSFVWTIAQIVCLSLYETSSYVQGLAITELIMIFFIIFYFIDKSYKYLSRILHLAIFLGLLCLIFEKIIDGKITPVGINSFLPFSLICLVYLTILIFPCRKSNNEISLPAIIIDNSTNLPPIICASGSAIVYKNCKKLNVKMVNHFNIK